MKLANTKPTSLADEANGHHLALERAKLPVTAERMRQFMQGQGVAADEPLLMAWEAWGKHQQKRHAAGEITAYTASW